MPPDRRPKAELVTRVINGLGSGASEADLAQTTLTVNNSVDPVQRKGRLTEP